MAALYPTARAHQGASDIDMDDLDVDLGLSGTPMMQDNLEVEDLDDMTYNEVDFNDAQVFDTMFPTGSPQSVAMDNQDTLASVPDENLLDYSETTLQGEDSNFSHTEVQLDAQSTTTDSRDVIAQPVSTERANTWSPNDAIPKVHNDPNPPHTNTTGSSQTTPKAFQEGQEKTVEVDDLAKANMTTHENTTHIGDTESAHQNTQSNFPSEAIQAGEAADPNTEALAARSSLEEASTTSAGQDNREQNAGSGDFQSPTPANAVLSTSSYQPEATHQAQAHVESRESPHVSLHPVLVEWHAGEVDWLFRSSADNARQGFYLEDTHLASQSYSTLFQELRLAIGDDISVDEEIEIEIPVFDVSIREDSCDDHSTFADIVNIYLQLQGIDGNEAPEPLKIKLHRRVRFSARLAQLQEAIVDNKGLSELDFLNAASNSSSEFGDQESQHSQAQDHSEDFDPSQQVENQEQFARDAVDHDGVADEGVEVTDLRVQKENVDAPEKAGDEGTSVDASHDVVEEDDDLIDYDDELITNEVPGVNTISEQAPEMSQPSLHANQGISQITDEAAAQDDTTLVEIAAGDGTVAAEAFGEAREHTTNAGEDHNLFADVDLSNPTEQSYEEYEDNTFDPSATFDDAFADVGGTYDGGATESFEEQEGVQPEPVSAKQDEGGETEAPAELPEYDEDDLIDYDDEETAPANDETGPSTPTVQGDPVTPVTHEAASAGIENSPSSKRPRDESSAEEPSSASGLKRQKSELPQDS